VIVSVTNTGASKTKTAVETFCTLRFRRHRENATNFLPHVDRCTRKAPLQMGFNDALQHHITRRLLM